MNEIKNTEKAPTLGSLRQEKESGNLKTGQVEIIQSEKKKEIGIEKSEETLCELWDIISEILSALWVSQKKRQRKGQKSYLNNG